MCRQQGSKGNQEKRWEIKKDREREEGQRGGRG